MFSSSVMSAVAGVIAIAAIVMNSYDGDNGKLMGAVDEVTRAQEIFMALEFDKDRLNTFYKNDPGCVVEDAEWTVASPDDIRVVSELVPSAADENPFLYESEAVVLENCDILKRMMVNPSTTNKLVANTYDSVYAEVWHEKSRMMVKVCAHNICGKTIVCGKNPSSRNYPVCWNNPKKDLENTGSVSPLLSSLSDLCNPPWPLPSETLRSGSVERRLFLLATTNEGIVVWGSEKTVSVSYQDTTLTQGPHAKKGLSVVVNGARSSAGDVVETVVEVDRAQKKIVGGTAWRNAFGLRLNRSEVWIKDSQLQALDAIATTNSGDDIPFFCGPELRTPDFIEFSEDGVVFVGGNVLVWDTESMVLKFVSFTDEVLQANNLESVERPVKCMLSQSIPYFYAGTSELFD
jgi:hypothetical protein